MSNRQQRPAQSFKCPGKRVYTACIVDDEAPKLVRLVTEPLARRGIRLDVYSDPLQCLEGIGETREPHDLLISDFRFPIKGRITPSDTGAYLPWRYTVRAKRNGWDPIATVLTGFYETYEPELGKLYEKEDFAPALVCDKLLLSDLTNLERYADALWFLMEGQSIQPITTSINKLPSRMLEGTDYNMSEIRRVLDGRRAGKPVKTICREWTGNLDRYFRELSRWHVLSTISVGFARELRELAAVRREVFNPITKTQITRTQAQDEALDALMKAMDKCIEVYEITSQSRPKAQKKTQKAQLSRRAS